MEVQHGNEGKLQNSSSNVAGVSDGTAIIRSSIIKKECRWRTVT